jgi:transmembrane sensor
MPHDAPPDELLLDRYLAGELTGDALSRVENWLAAHPATAARLRTLPEAALGEFPLWSTDASWQQLSSRIASHDELGSRRSRAEPAGPVRIASRTPWLRVAAVAAVLLAGVTTWRMRTPAMAGGRVDAPIGRDVTATLPDGSTVLLTAGSHATWSVDFGTASREIQLHGEALFDVVHDAARPFRVRTRDAVAEDIGTRFVVRAWPELMRVDVAVEEGIVALSDTVHAPAARGILLRAGDRGQLQADGRVTVTADADAVLARSRGQLVFDNEPLRTVLPAIGRRFGVTVRADPALVERRLTARFAGQSLRDVLEALALSLGVRAVTADSAITLVPVAR